MCAPKQLRFRLLAKAKASQAAAVCLACGCFGLWNLSALAQSIPVPRTGATPNSAISDEARGIFDSQHLADRPYSGVLPQPIFPSTKRVQRLFTVAYAYDYAYSMYTPAASLPIVSRAAAKLDTPEAAAIAYTSAARTGRPGRVSSCIRPSLKRSCFARRSQTRRWALQGSKPTLRRCFPERQSSSSRALR